MHYRLKNLLPFGENKLVYLDVIAKQKGSAESKTHETQTIITGCEHIIGWPIDSQTGRYIDIFKDEEERKFFEKKLGLKEDELNVYAQADSLKWPAQIANQVRIKKDGIKFNMASPIDYIKYRLTALSPKVALTHSEAKERKAETEYVFVNIEEKALDENKTLTVKMQAYDKVKSIIENPKKKEALYKVLFDQPVPVKWSDAQLRNKILIATEEKPKQVLETLEDPDFEIKLLILEAVQAGALVKVGTGYKLDYQDKQSIIANNKNSLVEWFKNKENNPQVITIKSRIKKFLGETEETE
jgi:hypothetical protein